MLYSVTSAIALAAPAVGSRPVGSSVIASTALSFLGCENAGAQANVLAAASAAIHAVRHFICSGSIGETARWYRGGARRVEARQGGPKIAPKRPASTPGSPWHSGDT